MTLHKYDRLVKLKIKILALFILTATIVHGNNMQQKNANQVIDKLDSIILLSSSAKKSIIKIDSVSYLTSKHVEKLENNINEQKVKIEELDYTISNPKSDFYQEYIYPIIISLIAAFIFWMAFSYLPEKKRENQVRNKIDFDIYQIYMKLFHLIDGIFKHSSHSPSYYQKKIKTNTLTKEEIRLGLQNKCLNESYIYYPELIGKLFPIGKNIYDSERKINKLIDRLFDFSIFLKSSEILLFENIRTKLSTYGLENYNKSAFTDINGVRLQPVDPSLNYMRNNLWDIYILFCEVQKLMFKNKFENREIFLFKVQFLFSQHKYNKVLKILKRNKENYKNDVNFIEQYTFRCLYCLKKKKEAFNKIEELFKKDLDLISNRNFIKDYLNDEKITYLLKKYYSEEKRERLSQIIKEEEIKANHFIKQAEWLENFYIQKLEQTKKNAAQHKI